MTTTTQEATGIEAAIASVVELYYEGLPASEAVEKLWGALDLTESDVQALAKVGLRDLANDQLHGLRRGGADHLDESVSDVGATRGGFVMPHARGGKLWRFAFQGADGITKPLAQFGASDCDALATVAHDQITGWTRRRIFAETAAAHLRERSKTRIADLPKKVQRALEELL